MSNGNDGVVYTVKELLAQQDKKLDSILQAVSNTVVGVDALRERVVIGESNATRAKEDLTELKQTVYLAEQRRVGEMNKMKEDVDELATSKDVMVALDKQADTMSSNRRYLVFAIVAAACAVV